MQKIGKKISVTIPEKNIKAIQYIADEIGCTVAEVYRASIELFSDGVMKDDEMFMSHLIDKIEDNKK
jgi:hypothetical protein